MNLAELEDWCDEAGKDVPVATIKKLIEVARRFEDCAAYYDQGHAVPSIIDPFWRQYFRVAKGPPPYSIDKYLDGEEKT